MSAALKAHDSNYGVESRDVAELAGDALRYEFDEIVVDDTADIHTEDAVEARIFQT